MSAAMTLNELADLLRHIRLDHSPYSHNDGKIIKYVDPHIDMRDNKVFAIQFRTFGGEYVFHTQNECRELPDSLYKRCMDWLDEPFRTATQPAADGNG